MPQKSLAEFGYNPSGITLCQPSGSTATTITATDHTGTEREIEADDAVLWFFPHSRGCRCSAQALQYDRLQQASEVPVYGVASSDPETLADFRNAAEVDLTLLSDPDGTLAERFSVGFNGYHDRVTLFLKDGEVVDRAEGILEMDVIEAKTDDDGDDDEYTLFEAEPEIVGRIEHPSVVTVLGKRGSGKTATGFYIAQNMVDERDDLTPVAVGFPEHAHRHFPGRWKHVDTMEQAPPHSVAVVDEANRTFHARDWHEHGGDDMSSYLNLQRQCNRTVIYVSQSARQLDMTIPLESDAVLFKQPGAMHSRLERSSMRDLVDEAKENFDTLPNDLDKRNYVYVYDNDGAELLETDKPGWFTDQVSNAFGAACYTNSDDGDGENLELSARPETCLF